MEDFVYSSSKVGVGLFSAEGLFFGDSRLLSISGEKPPLFCADNKEDNIAELFPFFWEDKSEANISLLFPPFISPISCAILAALNELFEEYCVC